MSNVEERAKEIWQKQYDDEGYPSIGPIKMENRRWSVHDEFVVQAIIAALESNEDCVSLSHVEDVLLQAGDFISCGGSDAKSILQWISDELLPKSSEVK